MSLQELKNRSRIVRDETQFKANTASRIGQLFMDIVDYLMTLVNISHTHSNKAVIDNLTDSIGNTSSQNGGKLMYRGQIIESSSGQVSSWIQTPVISIVSSLPSSPSEGDRYIYLINNKIYEYNGASWELDPATDPSAVSGSAVIVREDSDGDSLNHIFIYQDGSWVDRDSDYSSTRFLTNFDTVNGRHSIQFVGSPNELTQSGFYYGSDNVQGSPIYVSGGGLSTASVMYEVISIDILNCKQIAYTGGVMYVRDLVAGVWSGWMNNLPIGLISITYNELLTKVNNSELEPGTNYLITDFRTVHHILDNNTSRTGDINTGELEPLIVKAVTTNELDKEAISITYPKDVIYYSITSDIRDIAFYNDDQSPVTDYKGQIYFRHDTIQNVSTWYDFRNVKFRRWLVGANEWISEESYTAKDVIEYNDILYKCKVTHSGVSTTPNTDTANWVKWLDKTINWSWTSDKTLFNVGDITTDNLTMSNPIDLFTFGDYYEHVKDVHIGRNDLSLLIAHYGIMSTLNNIVFNTEDGVSCITSTFGELCFNNTIGNGFGSNTVGNNFFNNTIGVECYSNTIGDYFRSNTVGNNFFSNTIRNSFDANTIGNEFNSNTIGDYFRSNTIGNGFSYNTIGDSFSYNTIGDTFSSNTIGSFFDSNTVGSYFSSNTIENSFGSNTIGNTFNSNTIGNDFGSNTIGNEFRNNQIANYFVNNTIADYFGTDVAGSSFGNIIGDYFQNNTTLGTFADNKIGNMCGGSPEEGPKPNTFGDGFKFNTIGNTFNSNTIGINFDSNNIENNFMSNIIGDYFDSNTIGNSFDSNTIGNSFDSNTIGNSFDSNTIGNDFRYNTIGNNFTPNTIGDYFSSNTIGNGFNSNTIGNNFNYNAIGDYFNSNTIGDNFLSNTIKSSITDINFTSATHVYQSYDCEIFKRSGGDIRLRYTDSSDAILTVAPTD